VLEATCKRIHHLLYFIQLHFLFQHQSNFQLVFDLKLTFIKLEEVEETILPDLDTRQLNLMSQLKLRTKDFGDDARQLWQEFLDNRRVRINYGCVHNLEGFEKYRIVDLQSLLDINQSPPDEHKSCLLALIQHSLVLFQQI